MATQDFHSTFTVPQPPEEVFAAITDPQKWWTGDIDGTAHEIGDEFSYRYGDVHYSKQKVTDLEPGQRIVWQVVESHLPGNDDPEEWTGTQITFEISRQEGQDRAPVLAPRPGPPVPVLRLVLERLGLLHQRQPPAIDHDRRRSGHPALGLMAQFVFT